MTQSPDNGPSMNEAGQKITEGLDEAGQSITEGMNEAGQKITEGVNQAVTGAQEAITQLQNSEAFQNASDTLEETLVKAQTVLGDVYAEVKDQLEQFVAGLKQNRPDPPTVVESSPDAVEGGPDQDA